MIGFSLKRLSFHCVPKCDSLRPDFETPFRHKIGSCWHCCATDGQTVVAVQSSLHTKLAGVSGPGMTVVGPQLERLTTHTVELQPFRRFLGRPPRVADRARWRTRERILPNERVMVYGLTFDRLRLSYALRMCELSERVRVGVFEDDDQKPILIVGNGWRVLVAGVWLPDEPNPVDVWPEALNA